MRFLSQGDFNFPFTFLEYWVKHFYMWSFQSGVPNPDGIIRLPGRFLNLAVFGLFGNIAASYFYIGLTLSVAFLSFFLFARHFMGIQQKSTALLCALLFAINPITLGNLSKAGLVLAASLLPLCLIIVKYAFVKKRIWYLLALIPIINLSFIHPYTFTINIAVTAMYFLYLAVQNRHFVVKSIKQILLVGLVAVLANAYFILPLMSMGTVSKDAISDNVLPAAADYTALVGVSNTETIFTGFALAKDVFKDFEFFNQAYAPFYYLAVFALYIVIFVLYLRHKYQFSTTDLRRFNIFLAAFLALILLATTVAFGVDNLIRFLISLPGGWAFRSPLKWQLYIPFALAGMLSLSLSYVRAQPLRKITLLIVAGVFMVLNSYQIIDVYHKLLMPRKLDNFSALQNHRFEHQNMLFVNNNECVDYMRVHPRVVTEYLQVLISKDLQVKKVFEDSIDAIGVGQFNYVMTCKGSDYIQGMLLQKYQFVKEESFVNDTFNLYRNVKGGDHIEASNRLYSLAEYRGMANKYSFMSSHGKSPLFVEDASIANGSLKDIFEGISPDSFKDGIIEQTFKTDQHREQYLYIEKKGLYYSLKDVNLRLSETAGEGLLPLESPITLAPNTTYMLQYTGNFRFSNSVKNASLEEGLWKDKVDDCYAYDNSPEIGMSLISSAYQGSKALQLSATKHIACTSPEAIAVKGGESYLINFQFRSEDGPYAGYHVVFDDPKHTRTTERMKFYGKDWKSFSQEVAVPEGAKHMKIVLYAYPKGFDGVTTTRVAYDSINAIKIPPLQGTTYLVSEDPIAKNHARLAYTVNDPTRKDVHLFNLSDQAYLVVNESYSPLWELQTLHGKSVAVKQAKLNNVTSVLLINKEAICNTKDSNCVAAKHGVNVILKYSFKPQAKFYLGAILSLVTTIVVILVVLYKLKKKKSASKNS